VAGGTFDLGGARFGVGFTKGAVCFSLLDTHKLLDIGVYRPVSCDAKKTIFTRAQGTNDEHRNP